jgi:hypothetical protein
LTGAATKQICKEQFVNKNGAFIAPFLCLAGNKSPALPGHSPDRFN